LLNAIKHQKDRYIVYKDKNGELEEVQDKDTGYIWIKINKRGKDYWIWIS